MSPLESISIQDYGSRIKKHLEVSSWDIKFKPGLRLQAQYLVDYLNGKSSELPTLSESIKTMELIKKIYNQ